MKLSNIDYRFALFAHQHPGLLSTLGDVETSLLNRKLSSIEIDRPVFISGLARSGTTLILNLLAKIPTVATHQYRDFPFLHFPVAWNAFQKYFSRETGEQERPHKDRIKISPSSPDAFEEPVWMAFFEGIHDPSQSNLLTKAQFNSEFNEYYLAHLKKILYLRKGRRYVSKENYNITRIRYLAELFPEALFIIVIRHPFTHIASLIRQHELFCSYIKQDPRIKEYLIAAGHFEFGCQRIPISISSKDGSMIRKAWEDGREDVGYAIQWRVIYGYISNMLEQDGALRDRIFLLKYEDLCMNPNDKVRQLLTHAGLPTSLETIADKIANISLPDYYQSGDILKSSEEVWSQVSEVAQYYGYTC